jgi:Uma2 family endonuclease
LLDGQLYQKRGQNKPHTRTLRLASSALRTAFGSSVDVSCQVPLHLAGEAPEPDVTVLGGTAEEFASRDPVSEDVALLVEVADSRLDLARGPKVYLYARLGISEYWILDLRSRTLGVRRGPRSGTGEWTETRIYSESESILPLRALAEVRVADLLPPVTKSD